jgi:hypothetical protein
MGQGQRRMARQRDPELQRHFLTEASSHIGRT